MQLPDFAIPVLHMVQPACSPPTYHRFLGLGLGALLTTGRRTSTTICRTVRPYTQSHGSSYHRGFSPRRWSAWERARRWLTVLLTAMVPMGPVWVAGEDTVADRPGPHVFGTGRHRAGVRSPHSDTAYRWGHTWVVWSGLVKLPLAIRPWALPGWVAL